MTIKALTQKYTGNVAKLLTLGRPMTHTRQPLSYRDDIGLDESDIPQLMQLADDDDIYHYDFGDGGDDEATEFFGVIHAWKALSELKAPEAKEWFTQKILSLGDPLFDDWILVEFRGLMAPYRSGMYAEAVTIIEDESLNEWIRVEYLELVRDMLDHGEVSTSEVNEMLARLFATSRTPVLITFGIGICTDHHLVEHYEAIAACYDRRLVDLEHLGDLEDVEIAFGMRTRRETKRELTESQKMWNEVIERIGGTIEDDEPERIPFVHTEKKVGRNDPCPCGSGKKYKKCCMNK